MFGSSGIHGLRGMPFGRAYNIIDNKRKSRESSPNYQIFFDISFDFSLNFSPVTEKFDIFTSNGILGQIVQHDHFVPCV